MVNTHLHFFFCGVCAQSLCFCSVSVGSMSSGNKCLIKYHLGLKFLLLFYRFIWPSGLLQHKQEKENWKGRWGAEVKRMMQHWISTHICPLICIYSTSLCCSEADIFRGPGLAAVNNAELLASYRVSAQYASSHHPRLNQTEPPLRKILQVVGLFYGKH